MQNPFLYVVQWTLALLALAGGVLAAERDDRGQPALPKPPPQPVEYSLKVKRGEKLAVPLKIYGSQRETLRFLIRKQPAKGRLSKVQTIDKESARVIYEPPKDLEVVADRFTYAVQSSSGVSAAVDVAIEIVDDPPLLGIPDTVEFQSVLAGQTAEQIVEVTNRGGGQAIGEVEVETPWRVEGTAGYRLAAGQSATFKLIYEPTSGGSSRGELKFTSDRTRTVALRGMAIAPVSVEPTSLELTALPGEPVRTGAFQLVNETDTPQLVKFTPSPRLQVRASVEVPAKGRTVVTVQSVAEEVAGVAEDLVMEGAGIQIRLPIRAKPVGPVLRRLTGEIDFGSSNAPQTVEVQNVGGSEGYWKWEQLNPFAFSEEGFRLPAGMKKELSVSISGPVQGKLAAVLRLIGEQQTVEIPVRGDLLSPSTAGAPKSPSKDRGARRGTQWKGASTASAKTRNVALTRDEEVQQVRDVQAPNLGRVKAQITELEPTRATVVWPVIGSGSYRLQERLISKEKGAGLKVAWRDFTSVRWSKSDNQIVARFDKLQPGQAYTLRIIDSAEKPGALPLGQVQIVTPFKKPLILFTPLRALLLVLAALLGAMFWQRRRTR